MLDHPILGALTVDQWLKFHVVHTRHHAKQIARAPSADSAIRMSAKSVECTCRPADVLPFGYIFARRIRTIIPTVVRETSPVVLVVEDDSAVRQPLVKFLQMRQYTVVTAETADEGLDAIKTHRPAAAIVDLRLRRGSGREVVVSAPPKFP